ncbi:MAG: nitroreductase family protein [Chloroflexi bacterium]|nr:nitroreductase family protein [Chloroflexota bacterium]
MHAEAICYNGDGQPDMDIRTAIHRRISVRHYQARTVPDNLLQAVIAAGEDSLALDNGIAVRFHLVKEGQLIARRMTVLTGTKLLFGSAPHFIVATSEEKPFFMLNMGFRMEQLILFATQQGLGTCWIGGMFREARIAEFLGLPERERVIVLTPIGYPDTSLMGKAARDIIEVGARNFGRRKPLWEIAFGERWGAPLPADDAGLLEALECARRAPSWANTQPWRFLVSPEGIIAMAELRQRYLNIRAGKHYRRLDVGIAMAHFFLAAREMGWRGGWSVTGFDPAAIAQHYAVPEDHEVLSIYRRR